MPAASVYNVEDIDSVLQNLPSTTDYNSVDAVITQVDDKFRSLGIDLAEVFTLQNIAVVTLVALLAVLLVDLISYLVAYTSGKTDVFRPISKNVLKSAFSAWDSKDVLPGVSDYVRARSLEPFTNILDAMSVAAKKWE